jgi:carbamoyltransferase
MIANGYIIGLSLGHNAAVCLLKDGEIIFSVEEERLTRIKADGAPLKGLIKVLDYTDKVDSLVVCSASDVRPELEYTSEPIYLGMARKLGLIETLDKDMLGGAHPQYTEYFFDHHLAHAYCAFKRSGFEKSAVVVVDGAGSRIDLPGYGKTIHAWETESIYDFPNAEPIYKKYNTDDNDLIPSKNEFSIIDYGSGIGHAYDAVTEFCGFSILECGKTMGLSSYGKENKDVPNFFNHDGDWSYVNPGVVKPNYSGGSTININKYPKLMNVPKEDIAYKIQKETQEEVLKLIIKAYETTGHKNICLTGGYALNCVSNYYYLEKLSKLGIQLYIEPNSSDAGTAIGVAYMKYYK